MSRGKRQTLALLLGNLILCVVVALANHTMADWQLRLWPGGLLVATAALLAGPGAGAAAVFVAGLALDATAPVPFGTHAFVLLGAQTVFYALRTRLMRNATPVRVAVAVLAGVLSWLGLAAVAKAAGLTSAGAGRLLLELAATSVMTLLIAPWFFALQCRLLYLAQVGLRAEERRFD